MEGEGTYIYTVHAPFHEFTTDWDGIRWFLIPSLCHPSQPPLYLSVQIKPTPHENGGKCKKKENYTKYSCYKTEKKNHRMPSQSVVNS